MKKKNALLLIGLCACLALAACSQALADGDWGELTGEPGAGAACAPGDEIVYRVSVKKAAGEEAMVRVTLSGGLIMEENGFSFVPAGQNPGPEIIWGNEGCVLVFSALAEGDSFSFRALVQEEGASGELCCNVTWDEETLTLTHALAQNPASVSPTPATEPVTPPELNEEEKANSMGLWAALAALLMLLLGAAILIMVRKGGLASPEENRAGVAGRASRAEGTRDG